MNNDITPERWRVLAEVIDYNSETGEFRWSMKAPNKGIRGKKAGDGKSGRYTQI